jgi:hypothetical protein
MPDHTRKLPSLRQPVLVKKPTARSTRIRPRSFRAKGARFQTERRHVSADTRPLRTILSTARTRFARLRAGAATLGLLGP